MNKKIGFRIGEGLTLAWVRRNKWQITISFPFILFLFRLVLHSPVTHASTSPTENSKTNQAVPTLPDGSVLLVNPANGMPFEKVLPDGTRVWICGGSVVQYSERPDGRTREVNVTGQAAFEVAKVCRKPFVVHAGNTVIRVLGTYFNVNNFADEPECRITLIRGKIQVTNGSRMHYLKPCEEAAVSDSRMLVRKTDHPLSCLSWASKTPFFSFYRNDLHTVLRQLARVYQVKISNPENFYGEPIDAKYYYSDSLKRILPHLNLAWNDEIHLETSGDTIYVFKR